MNTLLDSHPEHATRTVSVGDHLGNDTCPPRAFEPSESAFVRETQRTEHHTLTADDRGHAIDDRHGRFPKRALSTVNEGELNISRRSLFRIPEQYEIDIRPEIRRELPAIYRSKTSSVGFYVWDYIRTNVICIGSFVSHMFCMPELSYSIRSGTANRSPSIAARLDARSQIRLRSPPADR